MGFSTIVNFSTRSAAAIILSTAAVEDPIEALHCASRLRTSFEGIGSERCKNSGWAFIASAARCRDADKSK